MGYMLDLFLIVWGTSILFSIILEKEPRWYQRKLLKIYKKISPKKKKAGYKNEKERPDADTTACDGIFMNWTAPVIPSETLTQEREALIVSDKI